MVALIILLLGVGGYILLTVFAPLFDEPLLTGKVAHSTEEKLEKSPQDDRLYIPQINVDVAIVTGSDSSVLEKGAWHRKPENGNPVDGGNFVLSAHRFVMSLTPQGTALKSPFYNIGKLKVGDRIYVDYQGKRYKYDISRKYSVAPDASQIEARTSEPRLTLYSCTLEGSSDGRDVIEAVPAAVNQ
jgi:LPXTG-site transpeptidase (sortase) family protein